MAKNKPFYNLLIITFFAFCSCNDLQEQNAISTIRTIDCESYKDPKAYKKLNQLYGTDSICRHSLSIFLKTQQNTFSEHLAISDSLLPCMEGRFDLGAIAKAKYIYGMAHEKYYIHCFSFLFNTEEIELISTWNTQGVMIDSLQSIRRSKIDSTFYFRSQIKWAPINSPITFWIEKYSLESAKHFEHPDQMLIDTLINYQIDDDGVLTRSSSMQKQ